MFMKPNDLVLGCLLDAVVPPGDVDVAKRAVQYRWTVPSTPHSMRVVSQDPYQHRGVNTLIDAQSGFGAMKRLQSCLNA